MTHVGYLLAGWGISLGLLAIYTRSVLTRGKRLSAMVAPERRRWIDSGHSANEGSP